VKSYSDLTKGIPVGEVGARQVMHVKCRGTTGFSRQPKTSGLSNYYYPKSPVILSMSRRKILRLYVENTLKNPGMAPLNPGIVLLFNGKTIHGPLHAIRNPQF